VVVVAVDVTSGNAIVEKVGISYMSRVTSVAALMEMAVMTYIHTVLGAQHFICQNSLMMLVDVLIVILLRIHQEVEEIPGATMEPWS
jgi:hypothetical protein